jgi:hypothetical protein
LVQRKQRSSLTLLHKIRGQRIVNKTTPEPEEKTAMPAAAF